MIIDIAIEKFRFLILKLYIKYRTDYTSNICVYNILLNTKREYVCLFRKTNNICYSVFLLNCVIFPSDVSFSHDVIN